MRSLLLAAVLTLTAGTASHAAPAVLKPELADIGFLLGDWSNPAPSKVEDTGGTATGTSRMTAEAGGAVLLRRDHTNLFDVSGKPVGGFDILMMIYAEGGSLHAEYSDGSHLIHYTSAIVRPGRSVTFVSAAAPGAPVFKLTYAVTTPDVLAITFGMTPPGGAEFHPIATGTLRRDP